MKQKIKYLTTENYLLSQIKEGEKPAIVMNGHLSKCSGECIQNTDTVFRFNLFETLNHAHLVGTKFNHWFVNGHHSLAKHKNKLALCPFPKHKYSNEEVELFHRDGNILYAGYDYRKFALPILHPTTGYIAMLLLLLTFRDMQFTIYGMDGLNSGHYWNPGHAHPKKHTKNLEVKHLKHNYGDRILWVN